MEFEHQTFKDLLIAIIDNRGRTCPTSETGIPLIKTNCIHNEHLFPSFDDIKYVSEDTYSTWFRGHPKPDDMIFVTKGTPGRVCWVPNPVGFCIAQDMVAIRPNPDKVYPKFLFALLRSVQVQAKISNLHVGTLIPHFKKGDFDKLALDIPKNRNTQKVIGDFYFLISEQIELNRRLNKTLEETAQGLFRSWFVDFDPVKAKARANELGCDPERAAMAAIAGKLRVPKNPEELTAEDFTAAEAALASLTDEQRAQLAETAALFPAALVDSELGLIPEGWGVRTLADIANFVNGRNFTKNATGNGRVVIRIAELNSGIGSSTQFNEIEAQTENIATPDTILFAWSGSLGVHRWHREEALINQHIFKVIPTDVPDWFAYFQLVEHMPFFRSVASHKAVTMGHIKRSHLNEALLAYPTNSHLVKAASVNIQPLYDKIHILTKESDALSTLRDTLLPKLLSGEVTVGEATEQVEQSC